jgi:phosphoribosylformimino-5-aminoimidazole carboxamide ribotide isomerase
MIAIPAIDIMNGQCVRLFQGDFAQRKSYSTTPLEQARAIEDAGITHLHLVDLDGAKQGKPKNLHVLEQIAAGTSLIIDFGGGIRILDDIENVLNAGAKQANIGTLLFSGPDVPQKCVTRFGKDQLIAALDINKGTIAVNGWQVQTTITAKTAIKDLISVGWEYFSVTDISRDGTMQGPNPDFYKPLVETFPNVRFIGGGGVATIDHLMLLKNCGLYAAVTGKAVFEGTISLKELATINLQ